MAASLHAKMRTVDGFVCNELQQTADVKSWSLSDLHTNKRMLQTLYVFEHIARRENSNATQNTADAWRSSALWAVNKGNIIPPIQLTW